MKVLVKRLNEDYKIVINEEDIDVGSGVTLNYYSDEIPATVIEMDVNGGWIKVQEDKAIRIDEVCASDVQDYRYERNTSGRVHTFYKTRYKEYTLYTDTGKHTKNNYGIYLSLNERRKYYDYSF